MIDVLIPVHNLKRGTLRVDLSVYSLSVQTYKINKVYVLDSSLKPYYDELNERLKKYDFVEHLHLPQSKMSFPYLFNTGILRSKADYIVTTGADFLFKKDFFENAIKYMDGNTFLLKEVKLLPKLGIDYKMVKDWRFPRCQPFVFKGTNGENLANGGCQMTDRSWWLENLHDERMLMWGAVDNLQVVRAKKTLKVIWMNESEEMHQWHKVEKRERSEYIEQFNNNQKILSEYLRS